MPVTRTSLPHRRQLFSSAFLICFNAYLCSYSCVFFPSSTFFFSTPTHFSSSSSFFIKFNIHHRILPATAPSFPCTSRPSTAHGQHTPVRGYATRTRSERTRPQTAPAGGRGYSSRRRGGSSGAAAGGGFDSTWPPTASFGSTVCVAHKSFSPSKRT